MLNVYSGLEDPSGIHCAFMKKLQKKNHLAVPAIPSQGELTRAVGQTKPGVSVRACERVCMCVRVTTRHTVTLRGQA